MKQSLKTPQIQRLEKIEELASKFGIKIVGTAFDVRCPAIKNPFETAGIEVSWASSEPNTPKARLFTQFEQALNAVKYAVHMAEYGTEIGESYEMNKSFYTELNVYGRAMFIDIVERMEYTRKPSIFIVLANYPMDRLDFNAPSYDKSTKVSEIYKTHIAPVMDPWVGQREYTKMRIAELEKDLNVVPFVEKVEALKLIREDDKAIKKEEVLEILLNEKVETIKPINFNLTRKHDKAMSKDILKIFLSKEFPPLKQIDFNQGRENDNKNIGDEPLSSQTNELQSSQTVDLIADHAFTLTDQLNDQ